MSLFFQPEELTLVVENVLQDSNLAAHDSAHSKLNNSKNLEPQQPKFKNNCLKMVNNKKVDESLNAALHSLCTALGH